jgi:4-oxalocrotonate tautomerase
MPHVIVKLYQGRSDQQKIRLAEQIVKGVAATLNCGEGSVSVAIEDIEPADWAEKVYRRDRLQLGEAPQKIGVHDVKIKEKTLAPARSTGAIAPWPQAFAAREIESDNLILRDAAEMPNRSKE